MEICKVADSLFSPFVKGGSGGFESRRCNARCLTNPPQSPFYKRGRGEDTSWQLKYIQHGRALFHLLFHGSTSVYAVGLANNLAALCWTQSTTRLPRVRRDRSRNTPTRVAKTSNSLDICVSVCDVCSRLARSVHISPSGHEAGSICITTVNLPLGELQWKP